jgi:type III secretion system FlhB-like substrate exporter
MKFWSGEGLYNHITRALKNLEEKTFAPAVLNRGHGKIYEHASKMLEDAKQEYILCQKSSTLILGPNKSRAEEIKSKPEHSEQRRKMVVRDIRLFYNSIDHAVDIIKKSGIPVESSRTETEDGTLISILLPTGDKHQKHLSVS